jgi:hypothetical protein
MYKYFNQSKEMILILISDRKALTLVTIFNELIYNKVVEMGEYNEKLSHTHKKTHLDLKNIPKEDLKNIPKEHRTCPWAECRACSS